MNSLCAEVEREVHVAHIPEVSEHVFDVLRPSAKGKVADEEGHLAPRFTAAAATATATATAATVAFATLVPPITTPSPVTITAHGGNVDGKLFGVGILGDLSQLSGTLVSDGKTTHPLPALMHTCDNCIETRGYIINIPVL